MYISSLDVLNVLLDNDAKINLKDKDGSTALHYTIAQQEHECSKGLIEAGADVNAKDIDGAMPIHLVQKVKDAELLYNNGADINAKDYNGWTSLHYNCDNSGYFQVVKFLVEHGADVNAKGKFGTTPYDVAKNNGILKTMDYLEDHGAE